jgi:hypothetical protein
VDFTIKKYLELINAISNAGYTFQTFEEFVTQPKERSIVLRHDVDDKKLNSLAFAKLQADLKIKGTYYFRTVPQSFDENVIRQIRDLGHEIGYHYENMDTSKGNVDNAYKEFRKNLSVFNKISPVKTICMHGSPLSKFDNRDIWKKYDYKQLGVIAEPYFDLDFNEVFYLTDTGRRWDGNKVSVRDKAMAGREVTNKEYLSRRYRNTDQIINDVKFSDFPNKLMLTFHPQRWTDNAFSWTKELVVQSLKNQIKRLLIVKLLT